MELRRVKFCIASSLVLLAGVTSHANAKGLVGKLPGNPASCPEEPCTSDPQHVLYALKWTSFVFAVVLVFPLVLYYISKLINKIDAFFSCSGTKPEGDQKQVDNNDLARPKSRKSSSSTGASNESTRSANRRSDNYNNNKAATLLARQDNQSASGHDEQGQQELALRLDVSELKANSSPRCSSRQLARQQQGSRESTPTGPGYAKRTASVRASLGKQMANQQHQQPRAASLAHTGGGGCGGMILVPLEATQADSCNGSWSKKHQPHRPLAGEQSLCFANEARACNQLASDDASAAAAAAAGNSNSNSNSNSNGNGNGNGNNNNNSNSNNNNNNNSDINKFSGISASSSDFLLEANQMKPAMQMGQRLSLSRRDQAHRLSLFDVQQNMKCLTNMEGAFGDFGRREQQLEQPAAGKDRRNNSDKHKQRLYRVHPAALAHHQDEQQACQTSAYQRLAQFPNTAAGYFGRQQQTTLDGSSTQMCQQQQHQQPLDWNSGQVYTLGASDQVGFKHDQPADVKALHFCGLQVPSDLGRYRHSIDGSLLNGLGSVGQGQLDSQQQQRQLHQHQLQLESQYLAESSLLALQQQHQAALWRRRQDLIELEAAASASASASDSSPRGRPLNINIRSGNKDGSARASSKKRRNQLQQHQLEQSCQRSCQQSQAAAKHEPQLQS